VTIQRSPLLSLQAGHWFKLICGASYHHLPAIYDLALIYSLAGADCIDLAADPAIVATAQAGVEAARRIARSADLALSLPEGPWLMVSLNDGEDPHFRKAAFDPAACPSDCSRPCERVCPTQAITFSGLPAQQGVIDDRCYGCGRCLPVCPIEQIYARAYVSTPAAIAAQVFPLVDAVEIHTQIGRVEAFQRLWQAIRSKASSLKLVAISCPDGPDVVDYLRQLWAIVQPLEVPLIWQSDGRPMSGDIGAGTTAAAIRFGQKLLRANLPGYVQLAGGTNGSTVPKLEELNLLRPLGLSSAGLGAAAAQGYISGIAYGSYARNLLQTHLEALESAENVDQLPSRAAAIFAQSHSRFDKPKLSPSFSVSEQVVHSTELTRFGAAPFQAAVAQASALVLQLKKGHFSAGLAPSPPISLSG
jgi:Fe-S-cluster-containing hydrogenase component 2